MAGLGYTLAVTGIMMLAPTRAMGTVRVALGAEPGLDLKGRGGCACHGLGRREGGECPRAVTVVVEASPKWGLAGSRGRL